MQIPINIMGWNGRRISKAINQDDTHTQQKQVNRMKDSIAAL